MPSLKLSMTRVAVTLMLPCSTTIEPVLKPLQVARTLPDTVTLATSVVSGDSA